jgi:hypothetical protein
MMKNPNARWCHNHHHNGVVFYLLVAFVLLLLPPPGQAWLSSKTPGRRRNKNNIIRHHAQGPDKGFNLLETASSVIPQGRIVQTAKESWKFVWKVGWLFLFCFGKIFSCCTKMCSCPFFYFLQRMMTELAPQDKSGNYQRPKYGFGGTIGSQTFPVEAGRYHVYVGNPCPVSRRGV